MQIDGHAEDRYSFISCVLSPFKVVQTPIPFVLRRIHGANASLSDEARLCSDDGWSYFVDHPLCLKKRRTALRRHMLCCLALPNAEKQKYVPLFARDGMSLYYLLFKASFSKPARWAFSLARLLEKKVRRAA